MKNENLRKYLFEFLVIFLSVTISFAVDEYRSSREDRKIANDYLLRLAKELEYRERLTLQYLEANKVLRDNYEIILKNFESKELPGDSLLKLIVSSEAFARFDSRLDNWESLLSSGKIDAIDPAITDSVNSLYKYYRDLEFTNKMVYDNWTTTWGKVAADLPGHSYINAVHQLDFGKRVTATDPQLDRFLTNTLAIDYYHSKFWLTNYVHNRYFKFLPAKEKRLITLLREVAD